MIKNKRIHEKVKDEDGFRVLVGRFWPRGFSKERVGLNEHFQDATPNNKVRL